MQNVFIPVGAGDYTYYPISYLSNAFSSVLTIKDGRNTLTSGNPWVYTTDKEKFMSGIGKNQTGVHSLMQLISVGF